MKSQDHIERAKSLSNEWFKDHVAIIVFKFKVGNFYMIDWRKPDTWDYGVRFQISQGNVIVTGDLGYAIYGFGSGLNIENLKSFDWHYFINKCVASETGRQYIEKVTGIKEPVPNIRAIAHYTGLQMALKQLEERKNNH